MSELRFIDANALFDVIQQHDYPLAQKTNSIDNGMFTIGIKQAIDEAPTVDAVPINELLVLRDWLYESDGITMSGLRSLNELLSKYSSDNLPRIENGYEGVRVNESI